ncbi:hypothetical protein Moror_16578 [Moniliophthora roreri MCA 2997]|uniref:Uncharacterized protein n=1 Tax=Moniliophthora roreri (strain MCA 2997) TaxID=1381753 RepID=V2XMT2_MONRO|nr:hypothetical protein Moror_16578 [Moniliophthora roreri MCA 2997]
MEGVRNQALRGLGPSIPEVSFDQFKAAVLPCVDNAKLEQVYYALKDGELSDEGWVGFKFDKAKPQQVPVQGQAEQSGQGQGTPAPDAVQEEGQISTRQSAMTENELYKSLGGKFNKVLEHTQEATGKPPLITFSSTPSKGLKSEDAHGGYIADINALLVDTTAVGDQAGKEQFECDIVMTGEFKKVVNDSGTDDVGAFTVCRSLNYSFRSTRRTSPNSSAILTTSWDPILLVDLRMV